MPEYDNNMTGALFANDKKGNDKAPDYTGNVEVNNEMYRIAGWIQTAKSGNRFMRLKLTIPEPKPAQDDLPF